MASSYDIDPLRRVVIIRASGSLTIAVMAAVRQQLKDDPAFKPDFDQISDLREVSEVAITSEQLRQAASRSAFHPAARIAIVVTRDNPVTFGMVRMYELLSTVSAPDRVGIFDTMEEAIEWLNSPRAPAAP